MFRALLGNLPGSAALVSSTQLATATMLSYVVQAIGIPLLTRVYSPSALGDWSIFQIYIAVAAAFAGLRYELAIPLLRDEVEVRAIARFHLFASLAVGVVAAVVLSFSNSIDGLLGGRLGPFGMVTLVLALVMTAAVVQVGSQVLIRGGRFRTLAAVRVANNGGTTVAQVLAGLPFAGQAVGLAVGAIAGSLSAVLIGGLGSKVWVRRLMREPPAVGVLSRLISLHAKFPLYVLPYAFVTLAKDRGLIVLFAVYGDLATAGALVAAQRLVSIPVGLITSSIAPVLHQRLASAAEPRLFADDVSALLRIVVMLAAPMYILLALTAGTTVPWILGSAWTNAAAFTAVLCISSFTLCLSGILDRSLDLKSKQQVALGIEASSALVSLAAGATVLRTTGNAVHALLAFVVCEAIHHLIWIGAVWQVNRWPLGQLRRVVGPVMLAAGAAVLAYWMLDVPSRSEK